jgi:hypothetical protein
MTSGSKIAVPFEYVVTPANLKGSRSDTGSSQGDSPLVPS